MNWTEATKSALERYSARNNTVQIERQVFLLEELDRIVSDTNSRGVTPSQTVSRVLQELRDDGFLYFSSSGVYVLNQTNVEAASEDLPDDALENAIEHGRLVLSDVSAGDETRVQRIRKGMKALRTKTLANYGCNCALCDIGDDRLLVTSHIVRWADSVEHRGLLSNAICFCTMHDKLFETGYFWLSEDLKVRRGNSSSSTAIETWIGRCTTDFKRPSVLPNAEFLNLHMKRILGLQA